MKPRETEIILDLLRRLKPKRILEWGTGYGTLYFASMYPSFESWVSIEHLCGWARKIDSLKTHPRLQIIHVDACNNSGWRSALIPDGSYGDFADYIEYPALLEPFDLILVDGRARVACLEKAPHYLNGAGATVLHDANRSLYHPLPTDFSDSVLFQDYRVEGGLWIGTQKQPILELIDLPRHLAVWEFYRNYGKQINLIYGPGIFSRWREVL